MYPVRSYFGQNRPRQMGGYGAGFQFQLQRAPYPNMGAYGYGSSQMQMFNTQVPQQGMFTAGTSLRFNDTDLSERTLGSAHQDSSNRGYGSYRGGQKRSGDNRDSPPVKKARHNSNTAAAASPSPSPSSSAVSQENFIVPVSHGTEKITMAIWNYFLSNQMTDEDLKRKLNLRKSLHSVMTGAFPNCRLFIVGSSMTGFATRTSDVDMCLMITEDEIDQKRDATLILTSVARALRRCSFVRTPQVIRAKVPILKFFDQIAGVECDLNINNIVGVRNTHLLRYYAYMDWRVRPLMLFIKKWARFHDINDASKKTISSYSLTLMLIHFLQVGVNPPVLPCLQKLRPDLFNVKTDVRKLSLNFDQTVNFSSKNQATLGELFLGFLNYYSYVFSFNNEVISVRLGKALANHEVFDHNSAMQWKHLNVEEPFERSNTARSVYDMYVFMRIMRVFKSSFDTLEKSRDVDKILSRPF